MPSPLQIKPVLMITGIVYALIGLVLAGGGVWLAALGGSTYYLAVGVGILATGILLATGRWLALWVYAAVPDRHADLGGTRSGLRLVAARCAR